jgi:hypothetical protein
VLFLALLVGCCGEGCTAVAAAAAAGGLLRGGRWTAVSCRLVATVWAEMGNTQARSGSLRDLVQLLLHPANDEMLHFVYTL